MLQWKCFQRQQLLRRARRTMQFHLPWQRRRILRRRVPSPSVFVERRRPAINRKLNRHTWRGCQPSTWDEQHMGLSGVLQIRL